MVNSFSSSIEPELGGDRRKVDSKVWGSLLGNNARRRRKAAQHLLESDTASWYARQLLDAIPQLAIQQRLSAGEAIALLGDPRFHQPYYLSEMIEIAAGEVWMGSHNYPEELPTHARKVTAFLLAEHPVTNAQFAAFLAATGHKKPIGWHGKDRAPEHANQPATYISAHDAEAYCAWLSAESGYSYRLPSEPEWELAARGATNARVYVWGETFEETNANLWSTPSPKRVCAVGLFPDGRGPFGHADLAGNVWEWCSSLYWPYPYRSNDGREDSSSPEKRAMRGGSWRNKPMSGRCSSRQGRLPEASFDSVGFRLARDV